MELNQKLHEAMGLVKCKHEESTEYRTRRCKHCGMWWSEWESVPDYAGSLDAVREVEDFVIEKVGAEEYGNKLTRMFYSTVPNYGGMTGMERLAYVVMAPAEQRAKACAAALGVEL